MKKEINSCVATEERVKLPLNLQFFAEGGEDGNNDKEDNNTGDGTGEDGKEKEDKPEKTFTQAEVTRMMTREKKQGRSSVYNELGLDEKSAKAEIEAFRKWRESQQTEDEKTAAEKAEAERKVAEAEERALKAEAKATAMKMGIKKEFVDDVIILATSKLSDDTDLETVISEIKTKFPNFTESANDGDKDNVGKKGTGSSVKKDKDKGGKEDTLSLGKRLAANRKSFGTNGENKSKFF